jgi:hypothetical protein
MVCTSSKAFESIFFWYTQTFPALHRFCLSYNKCDTFFPVSTKPFASHVVVMAIWGSERNQSFSRDSLISSQWWSVMGTPMCRGEVKWVWRTVRAIPYTSWFVCQCVMWRHLKETLGKIGVHFLNVGVHFVGPVTAVVMSENGPKTTVQQAYSRNCFALEPPCLGVSDFSQSVLKFPLLW